MKILAVALADEAQRFVRGYPPKGARLFLQPNPDVMRLAALLSPGDQLRYIDERIETPDWTGQDLCLIYVGFSQEDRARELLHGRAGVGCPTVFFGPRVTSWQEAAPDWCRTRVIGDIVDVWARLRRDAQSGQLHPVYRASGMPIYVPPRPIKLDPEMDSSRQTVQFVVGCFCPKQVRPFCSGHIYYGTNTLARNPEEVVGEVLTLPRKRIHLLDDDVASLPDYYLELFARLRNYHRHWVVNASDRLFDQPRLIRLLAKAGTKIVFLNESFLLGRLRRAAENHRLVHHLYRRVKSLQANKMLVGARMVLPIEPSAPADYDGIASVLHQIDLDFIEPRFLCPDGNLASVSYRPMVTAAEPAWLKNRFYSMETIADRIVRRPRRVGVFTTAVYLLPYSAAYRQNFLEGMPWP